jgi:hypothetical protein
MFLLLLKLLFFGLKPLQFILFFLWRRQSFPLNKRHTNTKRKVKFGLFFANFFSSTVGNHSLETCINSDNENLRPPGTVLHASSLMQNTFALEQCVFFFALPRNLPAQPQFCPPAGPLGPRGTPCGTATCAYSA